MALYYAGAGAPSNGTSGTLVGSAYQGDFYYDNVNAILYLNTGDHTSPTWTATANTFTTNISVGGTLAVTGKATFAAASVFTPDTTQVLTASSTIAVDAGFIKISSASAITITAHPAIATTSVAAGTRIAVLNTNASNAITLTDDGTDSGSKIKVRTSTTIALAAGLIYQFMFDGTLWVVL